MSFPTSNKYVNPTDEFMNSSSIVAKLAFLLLVLFVFVLVLHVGINLLSWLFSPSSNPVLVKGTVDAKQLIVIPQDPSLQGSKTILRSVNESDGIEFSWSVFVYIEDLTYNAGKLKCIFYKGDDEDGTMMRNATCPGLFLAPDSNELVITMSTFNTINEEIRIPNIGLQKWYSIVLRCEGKTLDVYINGMIAKSHHLHGVPKQNYGNVFVAQNGGFSGYLSQLVYHNYALSVSEIDSLAARGPDLSMSNANNAFASKNTNYLSLRWFFGPSASV